jgi:hypothetical protein
LNGGFPLDRANSGGVRHDRKWEGPAASPI